MRSPSITTNLSQRERTSRIGQQPMITQRGMLLLAGVFNLVAACAGHVPAGNPLPTSQNGGFASAPEWSDTVSGRTRGADRLISPYDVLEITVFEAAELSRAVRVLEGGDISLPLVGVVQAAGQTTRDLEAELRAQLQRYVHDPHVTVEVKEVGTPAVYVVGEVNQPGAFVPSGRGGMTVLRAVAMARGWKPTASPNRSVVIRTVPSGDRLEIPVDMNDIVRGRMDDLVLQGNDVLYVPKNTEKVLALGVIDTLVRLVTFRPGF
jgi:polysaccharide biosynthesis/export protein